MTGITKLLAATAMTFIAFSANAGNLATKDVVVDRGGKIIKNTFGNCVRTQWEEGVDKCGEPAPEVVAEEPAPAPTVVDPLEDLAKTGVAVYFDFDKDEITAASAATLDDLAAKVNASTEVKKTIIIGYADRIGNAEYNQKLSRKRALAVQKYLLAKGVQNAEVADVYAAGSKYSTTPCDDGNAKSALIDCLQPDRKVEIRIDHVRFSN